MYGFRAPLHQILPFLFVASAACEKPADRASDKAASAEVPSKAPENKAPAKGPAGSKPASETPMQAAKAPTGKAPTAPAEVSPGQAPPTPTMPAEWKVIADVNFAPVDIKPVSTSLGGNVIALRNTTFDVGGKQLKLNTIVAGSDADADAIVKAIKKMKSEEGFVRKGQLIYEFVGGNDVLDQIRKGRALLTRTP